MKFTLPSSAVLCQPDLVEIRLGPLRVIKLLNKIQENAYFVGFKQNTTSILGYLVLSA